MQLMPEATAARKRELADELRREAELLRPTLSFEQEASMDRVLALAIAHLEVPRTSVHSRRV